MTERKVDGVEFRKASFSNTTGNCVEVATLADGCRAVRNSRDRRHIQIYHAAEWESFLSAIRAGEFRL